MIMETGNPRIVIANWKCNKTLSSAREWMRNFARTYEPSANVRVIIAPPMIWLVSLAEMLKELALPSVTLAAQDISSFPRGGYTGAIAADMVVPYADYVMIGHGERRRYFHETTNDSMNKVREAVDAGLHPIFCVDPDNITAQLTALGEVDCSELIISFNLVEQATHQRGPHPEEVCKKARFIAEISPGRPLVVEGSITPANALSYADIAEISGFMADRAGLDAETFCELINIVEK
jgi:triosephosphate isomerase